MYFQLTRTEATVNGLGREHADRIVSIRCTVLWSTLPRGHYNLLSLLPICSGVIFCCIFLHSFYRLIVTAKCNLVVRI